MALNFVAIDFEIAAPKWDTVCSVAMAKVRDGAIVDEYTTLVNPECEFGPMQMRVHGITPLMVAGAPTFRDIAQQVLDFIGDDVLISHNIPFDGNVLQRMLVKYDLPVPTIDTFCTLACSNMYDPALPDHRLPTVCKEYGVTLTHHHDAGADTRACAEIMIAMANRMEADSMDDVVAHLHMQYGQINAYSVISPRLSNGMPVYLSGNNAMPARNPFAIQEGLRTQCPDFANEITLDQLKDGKTVAIKVSGAVLLYLIIGANTAYIKAPEVSDPAAITPYASRYKDGSYKLPVDRDFNYDRFIEIMADRCRELYSASVSASFGCCNDFILCSDAKKCIKSNDPFYKGCQYRKNLEAGRIFYGKNKTI